MRPTVQGDDFKYYEYVLCYVDDVLVIYHQQGCTIDGIKAIFKLKNDKADKPGMYLGAVVQEVVADTGRKCWTLSSEKYIDTAIENVQKKLEKSGDRLLTTCVTSFQSNYHS